MTLKNELEKLINDYGGDEVMSALEDCSPFKERNEESAAKSDLYWKQQHEAKYRDVTNLDEFIKVKPSWISGQKLARLYNELPALQLTCGVNARFADRRELCFVSSWDNLKLCVDFFEQRGFTYRPTFPDTELEWDLFVLEHLPRLKRQQYRKFPARYRDITKALFSFR